MTTEEYQRLIQFLQDNYPELLEKYPKRWLERGYPVFKPMEQFTSADQEEIDVIVQQWKIMNMIR